MTQNLDMTALAAELTGHMLLPDSPGYPDAIACFNVAVTHAPAVVVAATRAADVQAAMRFATAHGLPIGVQATGHGAIAPIDAGVLVTTRGLDRLVVDAAGRTATVGAGVVFKDVIAAAAPHGLAPLNGSASSVSAVGYTLGGGLPVMARTFGFAADRVRSFEIVTPDGELRHADRDSEPDLYWGLRGGKGNLGIVTSMTFELVEVATLYGGGIFFAAEHIPAVLHAYREWSPTLPEAMTASVSILRLPPLPDVPEFLAGKTVAHLRICYVGDAAEGARLIEPMRAVAPALADTVGEMPYTAVDSIHMDPEHPVPFYYRGALLRELTADVVDGILAIVGPDVPTPLLVCEFRQMGGALTRSPEATNAVTGRDAAYHLFALGVMMPEIATLVPGAVDAVIAAAAPVDTGRTLVNFHGPLGDEADRARAWDETTYERLGALSLHHDPAGLLRHGHAIGRPAE